MSIAGKQLLIDGIISDMACDLTGVQLIALKDRLHDQLENFSVESAGRVGEDSTDYLDAFISAKQIEGRSTKTLDRYRYILERMFKQINVSTKRILVYHLREYLTSLKESGSSDRTLEGIRSVMSSFFGWLHKEGLIDKNPCANLGVIKYRKKVLLPFSDVELHRIKEACLSIRDEAIVFFLLSTGCRVSEVCGLNRNSVNFTTRECVVLGKGNKERTVYIDRVAAMVLRRYLSSRKDLSLALFAGKGTDRLTPGGIRKILNTIGARAGVNHVHPHRFRRTLATNLIDRGMPIQEVACILGHDNINTTMMYMYIDQSHVRSSYEKCV